MICYHSNTTIGSSHKSPYMIHQAEFLCLYSTFTPFLNLEHAMVWLIDLRGDTLTKTIGGLTELHCVYTYSSNYNIKLWMTTPVKNCSLLTAFVVSLFNAEQKHCNIQYILEPNTGVCDRSLIYNYVRHTSPASTCSFRSRQPAQIRLTYTRLSTRFSFYGKEVRSLVI